MLGMKFGRWTVTEVGLRKGRHKAWRCVCDCGTERIHIAAKIRHRGDHQSCGCLKRELVSARRTSHGESSKTAEYRAWSNIKSRCTNPNVPCFANYGGRGIVLCDRWRASFEAFLADMGRRPSPDHTIDRIDNNGPYAPENCRWATRRDQARNKRSNVLVTHDGTTAPVVEWCERLGLSYHAVRQRIHKGWTPRQALGLDSR